MTQTLSHSEKGLDIDGNNVTINNYVNSNPQVIGKIDLLDSSKEHEFTCDDCGSYVDDIWADPRVEVKTFDSMNAKEPSSVRMICEFCADELFGDYSPSSIFG